MSPIDTILFDFGGTLDADGVAWKERFHALYRDDGLDVSAEAFAPVFYAADDPLVGGLSREAGLAETAQALVDNLEAELARRGLAASDAARARRIAARFVADAETVFARNRPALEALAARYRLGIVSNFYGNLAAVCDSAGLTPLFGAFADSEIVGAEKPEPAIFEAALAPLGASPERTLFVGDSLRRDREGARRMGMDFVWIAPEGAEAAAPVAARIASVSEIASVLP